MLEQAQQAGRSITQLVQRLERLRNARERLLKTAQVLLNLQPAELTISGLAARAGEALRAELMRLAHDLKQTLLRLREANDRNQLLIRQGLGVVRDLIGGITGNPALHAYDRRGLMPGAIGGSGSLLDLRG